jgi:hypothetical protein
MVERVGSRQPTTGSRGGRVTPGARGWPLPPPEGSNNMENELQKTIHAGMKSSNTKNNLQK